ncbi:MAG: hypothetical protein ACLPTQ_06985, partial [Terriglobales bacterium]
MNTFRELLIEIPAAAEQRRTTPIREQVQREAVSPAASVHDEQIHALVQQLFFRPGSRPVRHVGLVPVEASTAIAKLCLAGCGKTRCEADAVPRNSLVSTAQPDKKKACAEKTSNSWTC